MKKLFLSFIIIIFASGLIFTQSITITNPNGGEKWDLGSTHIITWKSNGVTGNVGVKLFQNGKSLGYIAQNVPVGSGSGSFKWTISDIIGAGPISVGLNYQIQVKKSGVTGNISRGFFSITKTVQKASINITNPHGGERWEKGSTYNIQWTTKGMSGNIGIKLFQNGKSLGYIARNVSVVSGVYRWTISNIIGVGQISTGTNYKIQLKQNGVAGDLSNGVFSIIPPKGNIVPPSFPASITVNNPKQGETWYVGNIGNITWDFLGNIGTNVKIGLYQGSTKIIDIIPSVFASNKVFNWKIPSHVNAGNYQVKISSMDDKISSVSSVFSINKLTTIPNQPPFKGIQLEKSFQSPTRITIDPRPAYSIAGKNIIFYSPRAGYIWKPLSNYEITFEVFKDKWPFYEFYVDVLLESADVNGSFTPIFLKKNIHAYSKDSKNSYIYSFRWKFRGDYNIPSGKYRIKVKSRSGIRNHEAKSGIFTINNKNSGNTAFLGADQPDLLIEDVFYDQRSKSIQVRVRNQGFSPFKGDLKIKYFLNSTTSSSYNSSHCNNLNESGQKVFKIISLGKYQTEAFKIYRYDCFDKRSTNFIPQSGIVSYTVRINFGEREKIAKSGILCKTKKSDIIIDGNFIMYKNVRDAIAIERFKKYTLSGKFKYPGFSFVTNIGVKVWNWGCTTRTFDIKLFMDGPYLNRNKSAITLGKLTLKPGEEKYFKSDMISFSIPRDSTFRKILLVADPQEANNQGYPNSYKNNFILAFFRFYGDDNTVRGR